MTIPEGSTVTTASGHHLRVEVSEHDPLPGYEGEAPTRAEFAAMARDLAQLVEDGAPLCDARIWLQARLKDIRRCMFGFKK